MTVTRQQWAAVAAERNITVEELHTYIATIDQSDAAAEAHHQLPHLQFDRDLEPLTLGQWSVLHGSTTYRFIRETILPNRYWIATIWQGVNEAFDMPPIVFETGVFRLTGGSATEFPDADWLVSAASETEALQNHDNLVRRFVVAHLYPVDNHTDHQE